MNEDNPPKKWNIEIYIADCYNRISLSFTQHGELLAIKYLYNFLALSSIVYGGFLEEILLMEMRLYGSIYLVYGIRAEDSDEH